MLLKYELKKLLISKINLIAMAVGFVILGLTTVYPVLSESEYLSETDESISGLAAIEYNQKKAEGQADELKSTNSLFEKATRELAVKKGYGDPDKAAKWWGNNPYIKAQDDVYQQIRF